MKHFMFVLLSFLLIVGCGDNKKHIVEPEPEEPFIAPEAGTFRVYTKWVEGACWYTTCGYSLNDIYISVDNGQITYGSMSGTYSSTLHQAVITSSRCFSDPINMKEEECHYIEINIVFGDNDTFAGTREEGGHIFWETGGALYCNVLCLVSGTRIE